MTIPSEITPGIFRFNNERFYGSKVGCYLIDEPTQAVLIEVPAFNEKTCASCKALRNQSCASQHTDQR